MKLRSAIAFTIRIAHLIYRGLRKGAWKRKKPPKPKKVTEEQKKNRKAAYSAYKNVIRQNATAIKAYSWQTVPGKDTYNARGIRYRPIAQMRHRRWQCTRTVFFTANNKFDAQMHIYTFNGQKQWSSATIALMKVHIVANSRINKLRVLLMSCIRRIQIPIHYYSNGDDYIRYNVRKYVMKNSKLELVETIWPSWTRWFGKYRGYI